MRGSDQIFAVTGNAMLLADGDQILQSINLTDTARFSLDDVSDEELDAYLKDERCLTICGGISLVTTPFLHHKEGRRSTANGMTLEYATELINNLKGF